MQRSLDRILTTHVGSLIRPEPLRALYARKARREPVDEQAFNAELSRSVAEVVALQEQAGVDIPSDGEFGKAGWTQYVIARLSGLEPLQRSASDKAPINPRTAGRDGDRFQDFYQRYRPVEDYDWTGSLEAKVPKYDSGAFVCTAAITYKDAEIKRDIANFKAGLEGKSFAEAFMPVAAPASARGLRRNEFYKSDDEFLEAVATALRAEYQAILDAGLLIQLDDASLAHEYDQMLVTQSPEEVHKTFEAYIELLNHCLRGIPEECVRYHVCWGSWNGPHTSDVPLRTLIDLVLKINAQGYAIEAANPRHEHEFRVWEEVKLPEGKILIPGLISHATNVVEHPDLVAWRIENFAQLVGRENIIASTDCGFSQNWNTMRTHPLIQVAKLEALRDGACAASRRLWR